jgi:uncharacterized protein (DUF983 family)
MAYLHTAQSKKGEIMSKTKKIYKYKRGLVETCPACEGTGRIEKFRGYRKCYMCGRTGGKWERVRELVGEEITK